MRLIKKLIFGIIGLVVTLAVVLVVLYAISVDDSAASIDLSKEYRNVETIVGEETYNSLEKINSSNYDSRSNNLSISITSEELNYYIVQGIRSGINPDYLDTKDYIIKKDNIELKSVDFTFDGEMIQIKIRINASFYHTSVKLKATASIDNKEILFKFEDLKLGFLPIPINTFKDIVKNMNFKVDSAPGFNFEELEFRMSLESLLKSFSTVESFKVILDNCNLSLKPSDSKLNFNIDTSNVFAAAQTVNTGSDTGFDEALASAALAATADADHKYTCTITEANFNSKISSALNNTISNFSSSFTIGSKSFTVKLGNIYYDFGLEAFVSNLYINNTSAPINVYVSFTAVKESNVVKKIKVNISKIVLGSLDGISLDSLKIDDIDISSLGFDNVKINNFVFNRLSKTFTVDRTYSIS